MMKVMDQQKGFGSIFLIIGLLIVSLGVGLTLFLRSNNGISGRLFGHSTSSAICTTEAKQCPDGSYVSRQGPKCEFALCPTPKTVGATNWKTYQGEVTFQYPETWVEKKNQTTGQTYESFVSPEGSYSLTFTVGQNFNNLTKKPFSTLEDITTNAPDLKDFTTIQLDLQTAGKIAGYQSDNTGNGAWTYKMFTFSKDKKSIYMLSLFRTNKDTKEDKDGGQIFDKILSTFKFLDQSVVSQGSIVSVQNSCQTYFQSMSTGISESQFDEIQRTITLTVDDQGKQRAYQTKISSQPFSAIQCETGWGDCKDTYGFKDGKILYGCSFTGEAGNKMTWWYAFDTKTNNNELVKFRNEPNPNIPATGKPELKIYNTELNKSFP